MSSAVYPKTCLASGVMVYYCGLIHKHTLNYNKNNHIIIRQYSQIVLYRKIYFFIILLSNPGITVKYKIQ